MPRKIWVSTTAFQGHGNPTIQDNIAKAGRLIDRAALDEPDIVCLPETFAYQGVPHSLAAEVAEPVPGPITEMAMDRAKKYNMNLICPVLEQCGDVVYNSAVVIDRQGEIPDRFAGTPPVETMIASSIAA